MPLIETRGAGSAQGFGEFAQSAAVNYIEDVFSTYLYTGNGSTQTITNGIDLSTKGGLVWTKIRSAADRNALIDSARGINKLLNSDGTFAQATQNNMITALTTTGYTLGTDGTGQTNLNTATYASWTFRKQAKFFDVVTYTGNGSNRTIAHNLGGTVGFMMIKRTDATSNWATWHRALAGTQVMNMANPASAATTDATVWNSTAPTTTVFSVGTSTDTNASGGTYVAYLWAHDAGGFGLSGTDSVISCGFYTSTGNDTINLGWEPQFIATRRTNASADWEVIDTMRGMSYTGLEYLEWNNSDAAQTLGVGYIKPTATGWQDTFWSAGQSVIYIAIRRGPMKVPTSGTSVFAPNVYTNPSNPVTSGFPVDLVIQQGRNTDSNALVVDRLRGTGGLVTQQTNAENGYWGPITGVSFDRMTSFLTDWSVGASSYAGWAFRRAPGFFDVVCYTGDGINGSNVSHNLGSVPELILMKKRSSSTNGEWTAASKKSNGEYAEWFAGAGAAYAAFTTAAAGSTRSAASAATSYTASFVKVGNSYLGTNDSGSTYVAYLFATVAGVSKVGSYTGSGATKQIDCGFTAGARFVLIKRTDSTGSWYCWDSARGIVAGNDPYLLLNSTAAEVTGTDYIDTYSAGFEITSTAPAEINASGGTFVFLSIA